MTSGMELFFKSLTTFGIPTLMLLLCALCHAKEMSDTDLLVQQMKQEMDQKYKKEKADRKTAAIKARQNITDLLTHKTSATGNENHVTQSLPGIPVMKVEPLIQSTTVANNQPPNTMLSVTFGTAVIAFIVLFWRKSLLTQKKKVGNDRQPLSKNQNEFETGMDANDRAQQYLDAFFNNKSMPPLLYLAELKNLKLDYSEESLNRLDRFLLKIRRNNRPDFLSYSECGDHQQFLIFTGIYLATTIARLTHQSIKWFDYEGAKQYLKEPLFPRQITTVFSCILGNTYHHLPIEVICDILFDPAAGTRCVERLHFYQERAKPLILISRDSLQAVVDPQGASERTWFAAIRSGGVLAGFCLRQLQNGVCPPTLLCPTVFNVQPENPDAKFTFISLMNDDTASALKRLRENPDKLPYSTLAYDSYVNLPNGRRDAVTIHIQVYTGQPAEWIISVPYQPKSSCESFALFTPIIGASSTPAASLPLVKHAFYIGVTANEQATNFWSGALQE